MPSPVTSQGENLLDTASVSGVAVGAGNDGTVYLPALRALWVGGAGNVAVVFQDGSAITFTGVLAGTILPICVKKVMATGTTATNMVGLL